MKLSEVTGKKMKLSQVLNAPRKDEYDPTEGMSTGERLLAGIGGGMVGGGRKLVKALLPKHLEVGAFSDEAVEEQKRIDEPLDRTGAGIAGKIIGETALTLPVGGAAGGAVRAVGLASKGARGANLLGRTLAATPTRAAVEGAVQGGILADPGQAGEGALLGGGLGGGLSTVASAGGRLARAIRVPKLESAKQLEKVMRRFADEPDDAFIPISQAGKPESVGRALYSGVIANIPGASGKIRGQYERALGTFRETAMARALPTGVSPQQIFRHGDDIRDSFARADEAWKDAFKVSRDIEIPGKSRLVSKKIADALDSIPGTSFKLPVPKNGVYKGQDLIDVQEALQTAIKQSPKGIVGKATRDELIKARNNLEIMLLRNMRVQARKGGVPKGSARARQFNVRNYFNWKKLQSAAEAAGGDALFTPRQLLRVAGKGKSGIKGEGGRLQELGVLGKEALDPFPSKTGIFQMAAALGLLGGGAGIGAVANDNPLVGGALGLGAVIGGARGLSSPAVQRLLMEGPGRKTQAIVELLRRAGPYARAGAVTAASQE